MNDECDGLLGVSQSNTKPIEKPLLAHSDAEGEAFFIPVLQQMKPGSIILKRRQKGSGRTRNGTNRAYTHLLLVGARL
jgi:hypothetical protein